MIFVMRLFVLLADDDIRYVSIIFWLLSTSFSFVIYCLFSLVVYHFIIIIICFVNTSSCLIICLFFSLVIILFYYIFYLFSIIIFFCLLLQNPMSATGVFIAYGSDLRVFFLHEWLIQDTEEEIRQSVHSAWVFCFACFLINLIFIFLLYLIYLIYFFNRRTCHCWSDYCESNGTMAVWVTEAREGDLMLIRCYVYAPLSTLTCILLFYLITFLLFLFSSEFPVMAVLCE